MLTARPVLLIVAAMIGATAGVLGSFVHPLRMAGLPLGLLCALSLTAVAVWCGGLLAGSRVGAVVGGVAWVAPVLVLSAPRPEGDLVVTGSALGYAWLLGGMIVVAAAVAWPYATSPSAEDDLHR